MLSIVTWPTSQLLGGLGGGGTGEAALSVTVSPCSVTGSTVVTWPDFFTRYVRVTETVAGK